MVRPFYVLSINGGGVRGLIVMAFLKKMDTYLKEQNPDFEIYNFFDLYAGTSIGALIIAEFLVNRKTPDNILAYLNENVNRIFDKDIWDKIFGKFQTQPMYSGDMKSKSLRDSLGDHKFADFAPKPVIITAYDIGRRSMRIFNSLKVNPDLLTREVVDASSAAPCYYPCVYVSNCHNATDDRDNSWFLDGGIYANNPTLCALLELKKTIAADRQIIVLNIGTGYKLPPLNGWKAQTFGAYQWAMEGVLTIPDSSNLVAQQVEAYVGAENYIYIDGPLPSDVSDNADDNSPNNLQYLNAIGEHWWELNKSKFDNFLF
jgi:patatin-like phospholipase/acyl hydrolase